MNSEVLKSIDEMDPTRWNAIVGRNRLICRHEYLRAIERSKINDCRYFYPVVYDNGELVAHACLYFITTELDTFAQGVVKKAVRSARKLWKNFLILRSVECGTPVALGSTISFKQGYENRALALMEIVRRCEQVALDIGAKVVLFRDFHDGELEFYNFLRGLGYKRIHNLPGTRLEVRWKSFDEYLGELRSEYRNKTRARMKKFQKAGGEMRLVRDFGDRAADLERLWKNVYDLATEYKREVLLQDFFRQVDAHLGERSAVLLAEVGGKTAGFMLLFYDDETLIPIFCGLDYEQNKDGCVYLNLFYHVVKVAIEAGVKDIDMGITTLVPKLEVGAEVVPLHMYMKHLSPALHCVVPNLFENMTPQPRIRSRNVFRKDGNITS